MQVVDDTNNPNGFKDSANNEVDDYSYDDYGNMKADNNKGITNISYNHLNLPIKITFGTTGSIEYLYNATGQKVRKMVNNGSTGVVTDYLDGYQYLKDTSEVELTFFPHAEGYVKHTKDSSNNSRYDYVFNYTDHLGNVRLSYSKDPITGLLTVLEENNYYPYGLKHKNYNIAKKQYEMSNPNPELVTCNNCDYKYKYNGKEFQDELGLNMTAMDMRMFDSAIGRFFSMDRMTEKFENLTPYQYAGNTPTLFIDVNGDFIYIKDPLSGNKYRYENGQTQKQKDGEWVSAKDDNLSDFVISIIAALNHLASRGTGSGLINKFSGEEKDVIFEYREVNLSKGFGNEADWKINTVFFDHKFDQKSHTTLGYVNNEHFITIGHEMSHLTDPVKYHSPWYNSKVSEGEIRATHYENLIRAESGLPLKTHYGSYKKGNDIFPDARSTVIDKSGNSVYYNTGTQRYPGQVTPTLINDGIKAHNGVILKSRFNYLEYAKR